MIKVLYVTGGVNGIRGLRYAQGARPIPAMDEVNGERIYRGQSFASGIVVVEDVAAAQALLDTQPANLTFVVAKVGGAAAITVLGFKAMEMLGEITDGVGENRIVGYAVSFVGEPGEESAGLAVVHV